MIAAERQKIIEYLKVHYKPGFNWFKIEELFGVKREIARCIWLRYRKKHKNWKVQGTDSISDPTETTKSFSEDVKNGKAEATFEIPNEIKTLEELEQLIDTDKWEITKYVQNYWGNSSNPHWQVKAWMDRKKSDQSTAIIDFLESYQSTWTPIPKEQLQINTTWDRPHMLLINLNDLHFDKLDITNNTIEDRIKDYEHVLRDLALKSYKSSYIEEITFVLGNDMFNTDNILNATANGTPQKVNETWDIAYEKVFDTMVKSISFLKGLCKKLNVVYVPGNHDRTKSYYLTHALEVFFQKDKSIVFNRDSSIKKRIVYGQQFIGLNHGNNVNDKLPLSFAAEFYEDWGKCKYHDIIISDKHHNNEKTFKSKQTQNEFQGVKLRILPSLSGTDMWHNDNLYHARQSGIALLYDKERGKSAEFEYNL